MQAKHFVIDAFVEGPFSGNPAAVCMLRSWPSDELLAAIAAENNLSETAFCVPSTHDTFDLRWFTPTVEIDLCGHATLATAHVLLAEMNRDDGSLAANSVTFNTRSGALVVKPEGGGYAMSLPVANPQPATNQQELLAALGVAVAEVFRAGANALILTDDEASVRSLAPDLARVAAVDVDLVCVTAPAAKSDVVARVFAPRIGIDEDPATGSAQCLIAPIWCERLRSSEITTIQASRRVAELRARWQPGDERVVVVGRCSTFVRGEIELPDEANRSESPATSRRSVP